MTENDQKTRHTGAAATFVARARDASSARVVAANHDATQQQADAQQRAASTLNIAHAQAAQVLGQNLQGVFVAAGDQVVGVGADGAVTATIAAQAATSVAVDAGAQRVYWAQGELSIGIGQWRRLPEPELTRPLRAGEVALYQDAGFGGAMWVLNASVSDFRVVEGLNDQVSSLRLGPNTTVVLFSDVNYQGRQQTFASDTASIGGGGIDNDSASSLRITVAGAAPGLAPLQAGEVALYEHVSFTGRCWLLNANTNDFRMLDGLNDQVSSIRVGPNTRATLFSDVGYAGRKQIFEADAPNLIGSVVGNDAASSAQLGRMSQPASVLPPQWGEVALFQHADYAGKAWVFNQDIADFRVYEGLNDQITSLRLGPNTTATLYEHVNYQGRQQTFTAENRSLAGTTIGSDTASSLQIRTFQPSRVGIFASALDGSAPARVGSVTLSSPDLATAGAIAVDLGQQRVVWLASDGTLYAVPFDGTGAQRLFQIPKVTPGSVALALDTAGRRIFWSSTSAIGQIDADGANPRMLVTYQNAAFAPALAVDAKNGYLYWNDGKYIQRVLLANLAPQTLFTASGQAAGLAIDASTELLYWVDEGKLLRADLDGSGHEQVMALSQANVASLALLTTSAAASDRLADAQTARQSAQVKAQLDIAQAHQDATDDRQAAHDKVKDAHTQATNQIADANQRAASRRQAGQQAVQDAHTQSTQRVQGASATADERRRRAQLDAQATLSQAQQQAGKTTADAQAQLDDARRKKQSS